MAGGVMPNLKKLVEDGCCGNLRSVIPCETSPAWSSFQTGCRPGKTGVFAFHTYDRKQNKVRLNSFADIAVPSIWELADRAGRKVVSLNMPVSCPPPKIDGVIIPGLLCPRLSSATVHPSGAYKKYIKPNKDYFIVNKDPKDTVSGFVEQAISTERARVRTALELMREIDWDIFCVQMQSGDALQHKLWCTVDAEARGHCESDHSASS
jgi:predicted AlkP superfamily phosphohydrolase/phosphomutase